MPSVLVARLLHGMNAHSLNLVRFLVISGTTKKPRNRGFFSSFFCCITGTESNQSLNSIPVPASENGDPRGVVGVSIQPEYI